MDKRDWVVLLIIAILVAIGAWQNGYIYRDREIDEMRKDISVLQQRSKDQSGRIVVIEGRRK